VQKNNKKTKKDPQEIVNWTFQICPKQGCATKGLQIILHFSYFSYTPRGELSAHVLKSALHHFLTENENSKISKKSAKSQKVPKVPKKNKTANYTMNVRHINLIKNGRKTPTLNYMDKNG
jgi:hypothetical protein